MKIFDCSNSTLRPDHRGGGGPVQNDVMRQLRKYAHLYGHIFCQELSKADVVITNDVFTDEAIQSRLPLVKRMDGVFFQHELESRNTELNRAAEQADHVIFISEFSRQALFELYPEVHIKKSSVALNAADPSEFDYKDWINQKFSHERANDGKLRWVACATDWDRQEKRIDSFLWIAEHYSDDNFYLIGTPPNKPMPFNVNCFGYCSHLQAKTILSFNDIYVHLAYRDAAPKTVGQALSVGLPVLYAESGGLPELVQNGRFGVGVEELNPTIAERRVPILDIDSVNAGAQTIKDKFHFFSRELEQFPRMKKFDDMLSTYFDAITKL